jgi:hypothetical protein
MAEKLLIPPLGRALVDARQLILWSRPLSWKMIAKDRDTCNIIYEG